MVRQFCLLLLVIDNRLNAALRAIRHIRTVPLSIAATILSILIILFLLELDYHRTKEVVREHEEHREIAVASFDLPI
jgi:hypothetical protein